ISTRPRKFFVAGSTSRPTAVTSPPGSPRNVTGAPTDNPRKDSLKLSTHRAETDSGCFIAVTWSLYRVKIVLTAAGSALVGTKGGVSKATPPASSATRDSVRILTPPAPSEMSSPLAFQKRVPELTYLS